MSQVNLAKWNRFQLVLKFVFGHFRQTASDAYFGKAVYTFLLIW